MTTKTAPHHIFADGKPLCGVKGKALIARTVASPAGVVCKRCLSRNVSNLSETEVQAVAVQKPDVDPNPDAPMPIYTPAAVAENRKAAGLPPMVEVGAVVEKSDPTPADPDAKKLIIFDMTNPADREQYEREGHAERSRTKVMSISEALNKPKRVMSDEVKAKLRAKKERKPVKTFLLDPVIKYKENGSVESITGTCPECKVNKRTIHAADAFQVKRCKECQSKAVSGRVGKSRQDKAEAKPPKAKKAAPARPATVTEATTGQDAREHTVEILRKGGSESDVADELGVSAATARALIRAVQAEAAQAK